MFSTSPTSNASAGGGGGGGGNKSNNATAPSGSAAAAAAVLVGGGGGGGSYGHHRPSSLPQNNSNNNNSHSQQQQQQHHRSHHGHGHGHGGGGGGGGNHTMSSNNNNNNNNNNNANSNSGSHRPQRDSFRGSGSGASGLGGFHGGRNGSASASNNAHNINNHNHNPIGAGSASSNRPGSVHSSEAGGGGGGGANGGGIGIGGVPFQHRAGAPFVVAGGSGGGVAGIIPPSAAVGANAGPAVTVSPFSTSGQPLSTRMMNVGSSVPAAATAAMMGGGMLPSAGIAGSNHNNNNNNNNNNSNAHFTGGGSGLYVPPGSGARSVVGGGKNPNVLVNNANNSNNNNNNNNTNVNSGSFVRGGGGSAAFVSEASIGSGLGLFDGAVFARMSTSVEADVHNRRVWSELEHLLSKCLGGGAAMAGPPGMGMPMTAPNDMQLHHNNTNNSNNSMNANGNFHHFGTVGGVPPPPHFLQQQHAAPPPVPPSLQQQQQQLLHGPPMGHMGFGQNVFSPYGAQQQQQQLYNNNNNNNNNNSAYVGGNTMMMMNGNGNPSRQFNVNNRNVHRSNSSSRRGGGGSGSGVHMAPPSAVTAAAGHSVDGAATRPPPPATAAVAAAAAAAAGQGVVGGGVSRHDSAIASDPSVTASQTGNSRNSPLDLINSGHSTMGTSSNHNMDHGNGNINNSGSYGSSHQHQQQYRDGIDHSGAAAPPANCGFNVAEPGEWSALIDPSKPRASARRLAAALATLSDANDQRVAIRALVPALRSEATVPVLAALPEPFRTPVRDALVVGLVDLMAISAESYAAAATATAAGGMMGNGGGQYGSGGYGGEEDEEGEMGEGGGRIRIPRRGLWDDGSHINEEDLDGNGGTAAGRGGGGGGGGLSPSQQRHQQRARPQEDEEEQRAATVVTRGAAVLATLYACDLVKLEGVVAIVEHFLGERHKEYVGLALLGTLAQAGNAYYLKAAQQQRQQQQSVAAGGRAGGTAESGAAAEPGQEEDEEEEEEKAGMAAAVMRGWEAMAALAQALCGGADGVNRSSSFNHNNGSEELAAEVSPQRLTYIARRLAALSQNPVFEGLVVRVMKPLAALCRLRAFARANQIVNGGSDETQATPAEGEKGPSGTAAAANKTTAVAAGTVITTTATTTTLRPVARLASPSALRLPQHDSRHTRRAGAARTTALLYLPSREELLTAEEEGNTVIAWAAATTTAETTTAAAAAPLTPRAVLSLPGCAVALAAPGVGPLNGNKDSVNYVVAAVCRYSFGEESASLNSGEGASSTSTAMLQILLPDGVAAANNAADNSGSNNEKGWKCGPLLRRPREVAVVTAVAALDTEYFAAAERTVHGLCRVGVYSVALSAAPSSSSSSASAFVSPLHVIEGVHADFVTALAAAPPRGDLLLSGGRDGRLRLWDLSRPGDACNGGNSNSNSNNNNDSRGAATRLSYAHTSPSALHGGKEEEKESGGGGGTATSAAAAEVARYSFSNSGGATSAEPRQASTSAANTRVGREHPGDEDGGNDDADNALAAQQQQEAEAEAEAEQEWNDVLGSAVTAVAWEPEALLVVAGTANGLVCVWQDAAVLSASCDAVNSTSNSEGPDGRRLRRRRRSHLRGPPALTHQLPGAVLALCVCGAVATEVHVNSSSSAATVVSTTENKDNTELTKQTGEETKTNDGRGAATSPLLLPVATAAGLYLLSVGGGGVLLAVDALPGRVFTSIAAVETAAANTDANAAVNEVAEARANRRGEGVALLAGDDDGVEVILLCKT